MAHSVKRVSSGSPYEQEVGFSRAARIGSAVAISGTAPIGPDGQTVGIGDPSAQARRCFQIVRTALHEIGSDLQHVIRTRMFLTDIGNWDAIAKVHGDFFADIRPASTIVQVVRLIDPQWLIEVEADAVVPELGE